MNHQQKPNKLIHSTSPYLKQHAYNPVDWHPWGEEALQKAKDEDKPMIISIGYSACHWCHVMERESFEHPEIAEVMNQGFVCIKVDREERPDVDQIYMEAIQTMGIGGGWPLNVFAMPDQKPFYGGTYFRPQQWMHILKSIIKGFSEQREQFEESAQQFARSLSVTDSEKYGLGNIGFVADSEQLSSMVNAMKMHFDSRYGGLRRAPKFPNPSIWNFLLTANDHLKDPELKEHIHLTLMSMADGGIYDQIGGGFARYSVDERWFAPHFEKMLYDNAQLIGLYSTAYQVFKDERFRQVVRESIDFVKRELMSPEGGFYAALDADSEGEEGNFYIWEEQEIDSVLGKDTDHIKEFYNVATEGNWERGKNILYVSEDEKAFCKRKGIKLEEFRAALRTAKEKLLAFRSKRERPGLDNKILTGWNAMMLKALTDAYLVFGEPDFRELALKNAGFIDEQMMEGARVKRSFSQPDIPGYLEDYALLIEAFYSLYQVDFDEKWLTKAVELVDYTLENFYDQGEELFYFTDKDGERLIARKKEIFDNVIPSSNSVMANNLFWLGALLENEDYQAISRQMLSRVYPMLTKEAQYLANWGKLYASSVKAPAEIAIVGNDYIKFARSIQKPFIPNKIIAAAPESGELPIQQNRKAIDGKNTIYVCFNKSCKLPVHSVEEALEQLQN